MTELEEAVLILTARQTPKVSLTLWIPVSLHEELLNVKEQTRKSMADQMIEQVLANPKYRKGALTRARAAKDGDKAS